MNRADVVSIHALAKRATYRAVERGHAARVSIHALAKRATSNGSHIVAVLTRFNPRPREEGDLGNADMSLAYFVSIHALAKRATG